MSIDPAAKLLMKRFALRRDDYAAHGADGSYRPVRRELTLLALTAHVNGDCCLGVYQLAGDRVAWLCWDVDASEENPHAARPAARAIHLMAGHFGLDTLIEFSGKKGYHVWAFCEPMQAALARQIGFGVLGEITEEDLHGCAVEVFPKQERVKNGEYGNLVKLPWGKRADNGQRGLFVSPDTLEPLNRECQLLALENITVHNEQFIKEIIEANEWDAPRVKSGFSATLDKGFSGSDLLPCYEAILERGIPEGHRDNVLFAVAKQHKRRRDPAAVALMSVKAMNAEACKPPLDIRQVEQKVKSAYSSDRISAGCEAIQAATLCPATDGAECPIYEKREGKREERRNALAEEEDAFSIEPLYVLRTDPPLYTATVNGQPLRLSLDELISFSLFEKRCAACLNFIPELPVIRTPNGKPLPQGRVWKTIVNQALAGVTEDEAPPEDASPSGIVWDGICEFLSGAKDEGREVLTRGFAVIEEGYYLFQGRNLRSHLKALGADALTSQEMWAYLRRRGADNMLVRAKDKVLRVWRIPVAEVEQSSSECCTDPPLGIAP